MNPRFLLPRKNVWQDATKHFLNIDNLAGDHTYGT